MHENIVTSLSLFLGADYDLHTLIFSSCEERACTSVFFVDDDILEENESLTISLVRTADLDQRIILSSESEEVTILNDDGMLQLLNRQALMGTANIAITHSCSI